MSVEVVAFDIGGVMIEVCHSWEEVLREANLNPAHPRSHYGLLEDFPYFDDYQKGGMKVSDYLEKLRLHLGLLTHEEALHAHNSILIREQPGIAELVEELNTLGLRVGCLSNTNDLHWSELLSVQRFPTVATLPFQVVSHVVGYSKPDPAIYAAFERAAGVSGKQIIYFDDYSSYVEAGVNRGWHAFHVDSYQPAAPQIREGLHTLGLI